MDSVRQSAVYIHSLYFFSTNRGEPVTQDCYYVLYSPLNEIELYVLSCYICRQRYMLYMLVMHEIYT